MFEIEKVQEVFETNTNEECVYIRFISGDTYKIKSNINQCFVHEICNQINLQIVKNNLLDFETKQTFSNRNTFEEHTIQIFQNTNCVFDTKIIQHEHDDILIFEGQCLDVLILNVSSFQKIYNFVELLNAYGCFLNDPSRFKEHIHKEEFAFYFNHMFDSSYIYKRIHINQDVYQMISKEFNQHVINLINYSTNFKVFILFYIEIFPELFQAMIESHLNEIHLRVSNHFSKETRASFYNCLSENKTIEIYRLEYCDLSDLQELFQAMQKNTTFKYFDIVDEFIIDNGVCQNFCDILEENGYQIQDIDSSIYHTCDEREYVFQNESDFILTFADCTYSHEPDSEIKILVTRPS